ncbi:leucyl aminopeptidase family protein [Oceanibacterium hippocampi]|uniref:Putative cytosol aminopeptidase n=1 Tax=Oceanibacterium hippocampi TaxID=745714 RepID=A0A1Y5RTE5_9PROT|nr:leucyl aminopeptidase family protein [Oceanibacterium hippocampi]SLN24596.1 putative cytosol aminopeptidase [Oceanibacterium hippocampi]
MVPHVATDAPEGAVPLRLVAANELESWLAGRTAAERQWLSRHGFAAKSGEWLALPGADGAVAEIVAGVERPLDVWSIAGLPGVLPAGAYRLADSPGAESATALATGWALGTYEFTRYKTGRGSFPTLIAPEGTDLAEVSRVREAVFLARDLINMPSEDLGPAELAAVALDLAGQFGAESEVIVGDDLLVRNFPMVHAVGRAATGAPRLIDIRWGDPTAPRITLVGKGVCFDSGGLDLKTAEGMRWMKKDMGGAAAMLGLARMVMDAGLPVRLRLLVPAVENAVAGNAFRPGDILRSRLGKTVEIGNTDAEGRLILADALAYGAEEQPELMIDAATLTGAARVAVGLELGATFTDDDDLWQALERHARAERDPLWRMPLWQPYRKSMESRIADIDNVGTSRYGGAITAALFLQEFTGGAKSWVHFDIMGFNMTPRPGRPVGGEAFAIRALYRLLAERFPKP